MEFKSLNSKWQNKKQVIINSNKYSDENRELNNKGERESNSMWLQKAKQI